MVLIGGLLNTTDAHARLIDDFTDKGVKSATITFGSRVATTSDDGTFVLTNVPRTSRYQIDVPGYLRTSAPTIAESVRLTPLTLTVYAYDDTKTPDDRVKNPQARDAGNTKIIATGNESGQIILAPHPGKNAQFAVCADGFERREVTAEGVLMQVGLKPGGAGCPPLPSRSPSPVASPSPSAPSPSVTASPSATP